MPHKINWEHGHGTVKPRRDKLTNDGEWMVADASARLWGEALEKTWPIEAAVSALQNQLTEDWHMC